MSEHIVEVVAVEALEKHPNADALSVVRVHGWQAIVRTADWASAAPGSPVIGAYIPPDSTLPAGLCPDLPRRVRAVRLRGEVSEGLLIPYTGSAPIGANVATELGVTHYEPAPEEVSANDEDAPAPGLYIPSYDVEHAKRYSDRRWKPGTLLGITEKLHGESWRAMFDGEQMHVGSRTRWKKAVDDRGRRSHWWSGLTQDLEDFCRFYPNHTIFGELYGATGGFPYDVQQPAPGEPRRRKVRIFDVWAGPEKGWWPFTRVETEFEDFNALVPVLGYMKWGLPNGGTMEDLLPYAEGMSTLNGTHIREGVVVRPLGTEARPTASPGEREVLKIVGRGYLGKKGE